MSSSHHARKVVDLESVSRIFYYQRLFTTSLNYITPFTLSCLPMVYLRLVPIFMVNLSILHSLCPCV